MLCRSSFEPLPLYSYTPPLLYNSIEYGLVLFCATASVFLSLVTTDFHLFNKLVQTSHVVEKKIG